ncbi:MAG: ATP-binding protein [Anaerolineae bacterium]|nr:ATP-binding protein [Anaerolineae bacterium]
MTKPSSMDTLTSLAAYRTVARNLPNTSLLMFDQQLRYVLAEGEALPILGFSTNRVLGYTLYEALPPQEVALFEAAYRDALGGQSTRMDREYGSTIYDIRIVPARNDDGVVFGGMVICQEVTAARRAEARLRESERRNRALLETMPDYMFVLDDEGRIVDQSPVGLERFGLPDVMAGVNLRDTGLPDRVVRQIFKLVQDTLRYGDLQTVIIESDHLEPNGTYEMRGLPLNPTQVMVVARALTELYLARNALQRRVDELSALREIEAQLADRLDIDYVLTVGFDAALAVSGAHNGLLALFEDNHRLSVRRLVGMSDAQSLELLIMQGRGIAGRVMKTGQPEFTPDVSLDPAYHAVIPDVVGQITIPLFAHGNRIGLLVVDTDQPGVFTEDTFSVLQILAGRIAVALDLAQLYQQLQEQHDRISELEHLKSEMLKLGAHDLGNPLMIMSHYINKLREDMKVFQRPDLDEYVNEVSEATERIRIIARDILDAGRVEMIVTGVAMNTLDLTETLAEAVKMMRPNADLKGQVYRQINWPSAPSLVKGDGPLLFAAASNLISNAIKYTPNGGRIEVSLWRDSDRMVFEVRDTGYGIPEDKYDKLFVPMQRLKSKETHKVEGTGFGLYLVKLIVQRHHGDVFFTSVHKHGSTFGFWLPISED